MEHVRRAWPAKDWTGGTAAENGQGGALYRFDAATASRRTADLLDRVRVAPRARPRWDVGVRVGIIFNGRAHRNLNDAGSLPPISADLDYASPHSAAELSDTLARFAEREIDVLVIDGGDGTIRDVLTAAVEHFPYGLPRIAVVPSGKTNALALDLGVPRDWTAADAVRAVASGRTKTRAPLQIHRVDGDEPDLHGFLFGAGAFVRATALAQGAHRLGAFHGLGVALSLAGAIAQTFFARAGNVWRRGDRMRLELAGQRPVERAFYMMLTTTLKRLPLGLKPFGRVRDGLKLLAIEGPPRKMLTAVPAILKGADAPWLPGAGYHRGDADSFALSIDSGFVLDGETYEGGDLMIGKGAAIEFVVP